jgi:hypothetical protein
MSPTNWFGCFFWKKCKNINRKEIKTKIQTDNQNNVYKMTALEINKFESLWYQRATANVYSVDPAFGP